MVAFGTRQIIEGLLINHDKGDDIFHKMESVYFGSSFNDRDYVAALDCGIYLERRNHRVPVLVNTSFNI
jgi:hypothetical protein